LPYIALELDALLKTLMTTAYVIVYLSVSSRLRGLMLRAQREPVAS